MCNNLATVNPYLLLIPSPAPDVPKARSLARLENNNAGISAPMFQHLITAVRGWAQGFQGCHPAREALLALGGRIYGRAGVVAANPA